MALTTGERGALRWLSAVALLGAGAQLYRNWRHSGDSTPQAAEALSLQLVAVDSAQRAGRRGRSSRTPASTRGRHAARRPPPAVDSALNTTQPAARASPARVKRVQQPTLGIVDVDASDSTELERLPRIGPALAARIVADRAQHGAYGSLAALQRVRGIGPKLAAVLAPHVTFSGTPRPSSVQR